MASVTWEPWSNRPREASLLEAEIQRLAPGVQVKLTLDGDCWLVRALAPAALCTRGPGFSGRDLSDAIAEILADHDVPARVGGA